jgi:cysteinyl-tRNA synthetase
MSKSLDNFFTIKSVLESYHPEVIRYFLLSSHYRSPLNYSLNQLDEAKASLERLYESLRGLKPTFLEKKSMYFKKFELAMDDDFNTPDSLAILFEIAREVNILKLKDLKSAENLASELIQLAEPLGLLKLDPEIFYQDLSSNSDISELEIIELINKRDIARESKKFEEADAIRVKLEDQGILLDDRLGGTIWKRK